MGLHGIDIPVELIDDESCLVVLILPKVPSKVTRLGPAIARQAARQSDQFAFLAGPGLQ
jgi:hypothetical protein